MPVDALSEVAVGVADYFRRKGVPSARIECYWYGGEPTDMGQDYFRQAVAAINAALPASEGFVVRHTVLSSLITVDPSWFPLIGELCDGRVQSSFDGLMRGLNYIKRWEGKVKDAIAHGLEVSTISVVNSELIQAGPERTLDYLANLGVRETSWLPFMLNEQNASGSYASFAPSMAEYSKFMVALSEHYFALKGAGKFAPEIGQMHFVLTQGQRSGLANIAGQTLFLLPNGDWALPDYRDGYKEYLNVFGNAFTDDFGAVLASSGRRAYIRRQVGRNDNPECMECEHGDRCLMEFWKENRSGDDCFGARRYVQWIETDPRCRAMDMSGSVLY